MRIQKPTRTIALASAAVLALALMPTIGAAQEFSDVKSNGNLHLRGYGSFFITGNTHTIDSATATGGGPFPLPGGESMINQMYVQFMLPQAQNGKKHYPMAIVHGCCLSTKSYQTTPDGRMGWDEYFVRQGFDTYMVDQVARARSGFDASNYNRVRIGAVPPTTQANIFIATDQFAWNIFRWGTTPCIASPCATTTTPHPNIRFPMNTVGVGSNNLQFYDMVIPDLIFTLGAFPSDPGVFYNTPFQMAALAKKLGGAILMGHSESSGFPTMSALQSNSGCYPWTTAAACKVKGIVGLETGCFGNLTPAQVTSLSHIPILIMYGDFANGSPIAGACQTEISQITAAGGDIRFAWLPQLTPGSLYPGSPGPIFGNEHMFMLDNNNQQIAQLIIDWASSRGL